MIVPQLVLATNITLAVSPSRKPPLMLVEVKTWYLETTSPGQIRGRTLDPAACRVSRVTPPSPELSRFFYTAIGGDWYWVDRIPWTYQQWLDDVAREERETWVLTVEGVPAGYFELELAPATGVEIVYFGLLPQYVGHGFGSGLLVAALRRGWERLASEPSTTAQRVWLHTCSLDHPSALTNYQARGLHHYKTETEQKELPERTPGPWPNAR